MTYWVLQHDAHFASDKRGRKTEDMVLGVRPAIQVFSIE